MTSNTSSDVAHVVKPVEAPALRAWRKRHMSDVPARSHLVAGALLRRLVAGHGQVTRKSYLVELADAGIEVSGPTVARAATELIEARLVRQGADVMSGRQGRPDRELELSAIAIGIAVTDAPDWDEDQIGSSRAVGVYGVMMSFDGHILAAAEYKDVEIGADTNDGPGNLVCAIVDTLSKLKWDWKLGGASRLAGIGIMIGGQVDQQRIVQYSPNINMAQPMDLPALILQEIARRRGDSDRVNERLSTLASAPILVENDADALGRYHAWFGHLGRVDSPMSFVRVLLKADGLGASMVQEGRASAFSPFEFGHLVAETGPSAVSCRCMNEGCLETVATPLAMAKSIGVTGPSVKAITQQFFRLVSNNDEDALAALHRGAEKLGYALADVMNLASPQHFYLQVPRQLKRNQLFQDTVRARAESKVFPGLRGRLKIDFEDLPDHEHEATAAAAQVVEMVVDRFEQGEMTSAGEKI